MAGRKIVDRDAIKKEIVTALGLGAYAVDACKAAGISEDTFARWQKIDSDFADRTSRAQAKGWVADLALIRSAAMNGDWRAAAEHLDRTGSPYRKAPDVPASVNVRVNVSLEQLAHRLAAEEGLDPADVLAEAESILTGITA